MGLRFRKSFKIAPGIRFNLGKKSAGISIGGKTGGISFNSKTGVRARVSAPGTGLSYSTKLGSKKTHKQHDVSHHGDTDTNKYLKQPVPRRAWYIVIALILTIGGLGNLATDIIAGIIFTAFGVAMLVLTFKTSKTPKIDANMFYRQLQIFDDSLKLIMTTCNIETFFGRYEDARRAACAMANLTSQPLAHGEPPQAIIDSLNEQHTEITNAFLDRYSKDIALKAYNLTRGRKQKIETFYLTTSEYEEQMTPESIAHRDELYGQMQSNLAELSNK